MGSHKGFSSILRSLEATRASARALDRRGRRRKRLWSARLGLLIAMVCAAVPRADPASAAHGSSAVALPGPFESASEALPEPTRSILVRYHRTGAGALEGCAETLWNRRSSFANATPDGSPSLDLWHAKYRARNVRALFRRPDGSPLVTQARRMGQRLMRRRAARARMGVGRARRSPAAAGNMASASDLAHVYRIEIADPAELRAAVAELRADPHVAFAQPDHSYRLDFEANDPFLVSSGTWGQDFADLWGLDRIHALEAWQLTRGAGQIVAVVDTGLDYFHPDIEANVWINSGEDLNGNGIVDASDMNGIDDDGNGFIDDLRGYDFSGFGDEDEDGVVRFGDPDPFDEVGHGTHVSGTVAAVANNGIGIAGVAPEARIMALKGFDDTGRGRDSDLWRAVLYAIENGAGVVNASWSCSPACPENPLAESVLEIADAAGLVFVTSAGNRSFDVVRNAPEKTSSVVTVGSLGQDDELSNFSNRGWLIDLVAPGGGPEEGFSVFIGRRNILSLAASTLSDLEEAFRVEDDYYRLAGTSMSSPHVAGAVALLRSLRPELSARDVRRLLRMASQDIGAPGHDPIYGSGVLDLLRLLETPLPAFDLAIEAPSPGTLLDPRAGPVLLRVRATGADVVSASLAYSPGLETSDFEEFARADEFVEDQAIEWDVGDRSVGPYVLRLRAELADGQIVDEFTIASLEKTRPLRISQDNVDELTPTISGRRIAWQALPTGLLSSGQIRSAQFANFRKATDPFLVSEVDQEQKAPVVSGNRLVWLERNLETLGDEIHGCVLGSSYATKWSRKQKSANSVASSKLCKNQILAEGLTRFDPIRMALGRILWTPRINDRAITVGCRWFGGWKGWKSRCEAESIIEESPTSPRRLLDFDGRTALFFVTGSQFRLDYCAPVLGHDACIPRPVTVGGFPLTVDRASIDEGLLAFEISRPGASILGHCELDTSTGECADPQVIQGVVDGRSPDVSGRRIAWTEFKPGERSSVYMCEVDAESGLCERHRLTGTHASASDPKIDGHRVVWQDVRFGPTQILGLELPSIRLSHRVLAKPGQKTRHPFWTSDGSGGLLALSLEAVSGPTPESWLARIRTRQNGRSVLIFRPPIQAPLPGTEIVWRLRGVAETGLETQEEIRIELLPAKRAKSKARLGWWWK